MASEQQELYRLWIEDIARLRQSRQSETHFFISINLAAFAGLGYLLSPINKMPSYLAIFIVLAMIFVNFSWIATDRWFSRLTWKKIQFLGELEQNMTIKPITMEVKGLDWRGGWGWFFAVNRILPYLSILGLLLIGTMKTDWIAWLVDRFQNV